MLIALALLSHKTTVSSLREAWTTTSPDPTTAGLWAPVDQRAEWARVLELTRGRRAMVLTISGCADLLFPQLVGMDSFYVHPKLVAPLMEPRELARITGRLRAAPMVVVVRECFPDIDAVPPFHRAMDGCRLAWRGTYFDVYQRDDPTSGPHPGPTAKAPGPL
jgi:hypothetical protein